MTAFISRLLRLAGQNQSGANFTVSGFAVRQSLLMTWFSSSRASCSKKSSSTKSQLSVRRRLSTIILFVLTSTNTIFHHLNILLRQVKPLILRFTKKSTTLQDLKCLRLTVRLRQPLWQATSLAWNQNRAQWENRLQATTLQSFALTEQNVIQKNLA